MVSAGQLAAFAAASSVLIVIPGPSVLFAVGRALAAGTMRAWFARSPRRLALIGGTGGLAMMGLGLSIAVTKSNT